MLAAVDAHQPGWPVAGFSSRGPTTCTPDGTWAITPDISAPGVDVRSSVPGGSYGNKSGTSMASPHIAGVVALMRDANPDIAVDEIKQIMYDTAFDLGSPGEDNSYGWGMVDAYRAVQEALAFRSLRFVFPNGLPEMVNPGGGTTVRVEVQAGANTNPQPGTGLFHYDLGGGFVAVPMVEVSPNVYDAVFPAVTCLETIRYYFSAESTLGELFTSPPRAPDVTYSAFSAGGVIVTYYDNFENNTGWTA